MTKTMKKFLSVLVSVLMVLSVMPFTPIMAQAATTKNVASADELKSAIESAGTTATTINCTSNINLDETITIAEGQDITIRLSKNCGYKIVSTADVAFVNKGTFKIYYYINLYDTTENSIIVDNYGTFTQDSRTYLGNNDYKTVYAVRCQEGSTTTFGSGNGTYGIVESVSTDNTINISGSTDLTGMTFNNAKISITSGDYIDDVLFYNCDLTISNSYANFSGNVTFKDSTLNITNGLFSGTCCFPGSDVTISGGTFSETCDFSTANSVSITNGVFAKDVSEYVTENYKCVKEEGTTNYDVIPSNALAKFKDVYYTAEQKADLLSAISSNATSNKTVFLYDDLELDSELDITRATYINLNGHNLTGGENAVLCSTGYTTYIFNGVVDGEFTFGADSKDSRIAFYNSTSSYGPTDTSCTVNADINCVNGRLVFSASQTSEVQLNGNVVISGNSYLTMNATSVYNGDITLKDTAYIYSLSGATINGAVTFDENWTGSVSNIKVGTKFLASENTNDKFLETVPTERQGDYLVAVATADTYAAQIGDVKYESFKTALNNINDGDTVTLLKDVYMNNYSIIDKSITIDLNGHCITSTNTTTNDSNSLQGHKIAFIVNKNKTLTINGTTANSMVDGSIIVTATSYESNSPKGNIILNGGTYQNDRYIALYVNGSEDVYGTITATNATIISNSDEAVYLAGKNTSTFDNCTITGESEGIEVRAGTVTLNDCTVTSKATSFSQEKNGSGTTTCGPALSIVQHTTNYAINVTVDGGTYKGVYAVYESDIEDSKNSNLIKMNLAGGHFYGTNADGKDVYAKDCDEFITGGRFVHDPQITSTLDSSYTYIQTGYARKGITETTADTTYYYEVEKPNNSASLDLKGNIDNNFYLEMSAYIDNDKGETIADNLSVEFEHINAPYDYTNTMSTETISGSDIVNNPTKYPVSTDNGYTFYMFSYKANPAQIAVPATITIKKNRDYVVAKQYSMKDYCNNAIDAGEADGASAKLQSNAVLSHRLLDYGSASQTYFNAYTDDIANGGDYQDDVDDVTADTMTNVKTGASISQKATGMKVTTVSFMSLSESGVNFDFKLADGYSTDDYTVELTDTGVKGSTDMSVKFDTFENRNFIAIEGIEAANLDAMFTVTVTNNNDGTKTVIKYSALTYAKNVVKNSTDENLVKFAKTLYLYNDAANTYFDTNWE